MLMRRIAVLSLLVLPYPAIAQAALQDSTNADREQGGSPAVAEPEAPSPQETQSLDIDDAVPASSREGQDVAIGTENSFATGSVAHQVIFGTAEGAGEWLGVTPRSNDGTDGDGGSSGEEFRDSTDVVLHGSTDNDEILSRPIDVTDAVPASSPAGQAVGIGYDNSVATARAIINGVNAAKNAMTDRRGAKSAPIRRQQAPASLPPLTKASVAPRAPAHCVKQVDIKSNC